MNIESVNLEVRQARWETYPPPDPEHIKSLQSALAHLQLTPLMIRLLANRGVASPEDIEAFLNPPELSTYP